MMMKLSSKQVAWALGVAGLIPFVGLSILFFRSTANAELAFRALVAYGMVILSFIGAIHWGAVLRQHASASVRPPNWPLLWGVIPSLWAWVTGLFPAHLQPLWLVAGLLLALAVDQFSYRSLGLPQWMLPIRWAATTGASVSLCAVSLGYYS